MKRSLFYAVLASLAILNSFLLASPNLLGKVGILLYRHYYLKTLPRTVLTVFLVLGFFVALAELLYFGVKVRAVKRWVGVALLSVCVVIGLGVVIRTAIAFTTGLYSHTGLRFQSGAILLPVLQVCILVYHGLKVRALATAFPLSGTAAAVTHSQKTEV